MHKIPKHVIFEGFYYIMVLCILLLGKEFIVILVRIRSYIRGNY